VLGVGQDPAAVGGELQLRGEVRVSGSRRPEPACPRVPHAKPPYLRPLQPGRGKLRGGGLVVPADREFRPVPREGQAQDELAVTLDGKLERSRGKVPDARDAVTLQGCQELSIG